jgi:hypothetical protein
VVYSNGAPIRSTILLHYKVVGEAALVFPVVPGRALAVASSPVATVVVVISVAIVVVVVLFFFIRVVIV